MVDAVGLAGVDFPEDDLADVGADHQERVQLLELQTGRELVVQRVRLQQLRRVQLVVRTDVDLVVHRPSHDKLPARHAQQTRDLRLLA